jgi:hypothetical protein
MTLEANRGKCSAAALLAPTPAELAYVHEYRPEILAVTCLLRLLDAEWILTS